MFLKLSQKDVGAARAAIFRLDPRIRGQIIEAIEARTTYAEWQNVGRMQGGKFAAVDFQRQGVNVDLATFDAASVSTLLGKLEKLKRYAAANPKLKFILDVRTRTIEQKNQVLQEVKDVVGQVEVKAKVF